MVSDAAVKHTHVWSTAVDGVWTRWTEWGQCDVTCGSGVKTRNRTCVGQLHGGRDCEGNVADARACSAEPCLSKRHFFIIPACWCITHGDPSKRCHVCRSYVSTSAGDVITGSTLCCTAAFVAVTTETKAHRRITHDNDEALIMVV